MEPLSSLEDPTTQTLEIPHLHKEVGTKSGRGDSWIQERRKDPTRVPRLREDRSPRDVIHQVVTVTIVDLLRVIKTPVPNRSDEPSDCLRYQKLQLNWFYFRD